MILRLALRSLLAHPVRSAVLAGGFGLGVAVMVILLGIGQIILEQARSPQLAGGGDVVITGAGGPVTSARFLLSAILRNSPLAERVKVASPASRATLYLVQNGGTRPIRVRGGIPSLERALGDPETGAVAAWQDTTAGEEWVSPDPGDVLRAMDRFHPIPDVPARAGSWAEWLYFNGRAGDTRFYLVFFVGPASSPGRRMAAVRLQLDRGGRMSAYAATEEIDEARLLAEAPDIAIGASRVRLDGLRYRIHLDLPAEHKAIRQHSRPSEASTGPARQPGRFATMDEARISGEILLDAALERAFPPITVRGAGGWISGYTVPVMSGVLGGELTVTGVRPTDSPVTRETVIALEGGVGYHDHNWGFWEGVTWQWGQVQYDDVAFVYGRVSPPPDAADPERLPAFLVALGPDGPIGHATAVTIQEIFDERTRRPRQIVVEGRSGSLDLRMALTIADAVITRMGGDLFGAGMDFLQMQAVYAVTGRAGDRPFDFTATGAAETFRGP